MNLIITDNVIQDPISYDHDSVGDEFLSMVLDFAGPLYCVSSHLVCKNGFEYAESDVTAILYLSKNSGESVTLYDEDGKVSCVVHSKFNRMLIFDSVKNKFKVSGHVQVVFLKEK